MAKRNTQKKLGQMEVDCTEAALRAAVESDAKTSELLKNASETVRDIFRRVAIYENDGDGEDEDGVNLFYAIDGYEWNSSRPIYDVQRLIDTLVAYGYDTKTAFEYVELLGKLEDGPIVMKSKDSEFMYAEIEPIHEVTELVARVRGNK